MVVFYSQARPGGAEKSPVPAGEESRAEGAFPHPEPSAKPARPSQAFVSLHKSFGVPLPPPAARWLWPRCPGWHRQGGTQGQGCPLCCPHHGDAVPGTHLVLGCSSSTPSLAPGPLGLLWVISPWLSQVSVVPQVLTAPYPCPQGQQGGSPRGKHRRIPGQSGWSASICPNSPRCHQIEKKW